MEEKLLIGDINRIIVFSDSWGLIRLIRQIKPDQIVAVVAASRRKEDIPKSNEIANKFGINVIVQPYKNEPNYNSFIDEIVRLKPQLLISNSYSMLIPKELLEIKGCLGLNIHASLLPLNRGPNPIQWAIIHNEKETGFTLHILDEKFDEGDIIEQIRIPIEETDTWITLRDKLNDLNDKFIECALIPILQGKPFKRIKQDINKMTKNFRLNSEYPKIDFTRMDDKEIFNLIRAQVHPLKGAYIEVGFNKIYFNSYMSLDEVRKLRKQYA